MTPRLALLLALAIIAALLAPHIATGIQHRGEARQAQLCSYEEC